MITLFSTTKPFCGLTNIIQRNAIRSWTLFQPRPEIILIGNEQGTAEFCNEFGLRHIPEVRCNEYGTPLVSSLFQVAQDNATYPFICYVNADIIFMSEFIVAAQKVIQQMKGDKFLLVGQRWNVALTTLLEFDPDWESKLREYVRIHAPRKLYSPRAIDYFFFPKGLWENIPSFAIGRSRWDNWFIHKACEMKIPVIDASPAITTVVHQCHDYAHIYGDVKKEAEAERNLQLLSSMSATTAVHQYSDYACIYRGMRRGVEAERNSQLLSSMSTIWDAKYVLSDGKLKKAPITHRIGSYLMKVVFSNTGYLFLYPLVLLKRVLDAAKGWLKLAIQTITKSFNLLTAQFGLNWPKGAFMLLRFMGQYKNYLRESKNPNFKTSLRFLYPQLTDRTANTPVEPTYFLQNTWAAGKIFQIKPRHHYDVGSSVMAIGIISQFVPVTMIDIRPIDIELKNLYFKRGSILSLPFEDNSIECLSSLCVVEHVGLGRYGDPIDTWGSEKAIKELKRVLKPGGDLLFSVPVEQECRIYFNAHRTFTREYILELFQDVKLIEEKYIYGRTTQDVYKKSEGFGTGLFHFKKVQI